MTKLKQVPHINGALLHNCAKGIIREVWGDVPKRCIEITKCEFGNSRFGKFTTAYKDPVSGLYILLGEMYYYNISRPNEKCCEAYVGHKADIMEAFRSREREAEDYTASNGTVAGGF